MSKEYVLNVEWVDIDQVRPYGRNSRKNEITVDVVVSSIKQYGWQQPIVVDDNWTIVAGHSRWQAAKKMNLSQVPVVKFDGTAKQAKEYRILDNRSQEESEWDADLLKSEMLDIRDLPTGFTDKEIDKLFGLDNSKNVQVEPTVFELVYYCDSEEQQRAIYEYVEKELSRPCRTLSI
jgi:ParB-like chromosome segregation protein Spo0J